MRKLTLSFIKVLILLISIKHPLLYGVEKIFSKYYYILKKTGMLTRDARVVERKKPGQPGARKKFQFSKR